MQQSPSSGGMTTKIGITQTEVRDNAYWPDESLLADFAEIADRMEQANRPLADSSDYATLYFVS